jgi:hypothetical protein
MPHHGFASYQGRGSTEPGGDIKLKGLEQKTE